MSELLPCPFCGCEDIDEYEGDYGNGVYCMNCGAMMGEQVHREFRQEWVTYEQAAEAWNTRVDYHGYEDAAVDAWNRIKAYQERTCRLRGGECDQCGAIIHEQANLYWAPVEGGMRTVESRDVHYCPNCGAKVVD